MPFGQELAVRAGMKRKAGGFTFAATVGHDEPSARTAAVGDGRGLADRGLRAKLLPCLAVVAVARQGAPDHHDQAGVGVDEDPVVGYR